MSIHEQREADQTIARLHSDSGVPRRYRDWSFDFLDAKSDFENEMHKAVREMANRVGERRWSGEGSPSIIALCGGNGTGKTLTASCAVKHCIERMVPAKIVSFMGLVERLRSDCYDGDKIMDKELNLLSRRTNLLVIDELDKCRLDGGGLTQDEWMLLVRLVEKRESEPHTGTILVSNWGVSEMERACGPSVWSRVGKKIECNWKSRRNVA